MKKLTSHYFGWHDFVKISWGTLKGEITRSLKFKSLLSLTILLVDPLSVPTRKNFDVWSMVPIHHRHISKPLQISDLVFDLEMKYQAMCPDCMSIARYLRETSRTTRATFIYVSNLTPRVLYDVTVCLCTLHTVMAGILILSHVSPYIQTLGDRIVIRGPRKLTE